MNKKIIFGVLVILIVLSSINVFAGGDKFVEKKIQDIKEGDQIKRKSLQFTAMADAVPKAGGRYYVPIETESGFTESLFAKENTKINTLKPNPKVENKASPNQVKSNIEEPKTKNIKNLGIGTLILGAKGDDTFKEKNGGDYEGTWDEGKGIFKGEDIVVQKTPEGYYIVHDLDSDKYRIYGKDNTQIGEYDELHYKIAENDNPIYVTPEFLKLLQEQGLELDDWDTKGFSDGDDSVVIQGNEVVVINDDITIYLNKDNLKKINKIKIKNVGTLENIDGHTKLTDPNDGEILRGEDVDLPKYGLAITLGPDLYFIRDSGHIIHENGKPATEAELKAAGYDAKGIGLLRDLTDLEFKSKGKSARWYRNMQGSGFQSVISGVTSFLTVYDQYSGWAQYGNLYLNDQHWQEWREKVNDAFCKMYLGKECVISNICSMYIDSAPGDDVVVARMPGGEVNPITIQGEKSLPMNIVDAQGSMVPAYLYKVTYSFQNPWSDRQKLWVYFKDGGNYEFPKEVLEAHESILRTQINPILVYGKTNYSTVCLRWDPYIRTYNGARKREKCVPIIQYAGAGTQPYNIVNADGEIEEPADSLEDGTAESDLEMGIIP